jgi:hypothetical protein
MRVIAPAARTASRVGKQVLTSKAVKSVLAGAARAAVETGVDLATTALKGGDNVKEELKDKVKVAKSDLAQQLKGWAGTHLARPGPATVASAPPPPKKKKKKATVTTLSPGAIVAAARNKKRAVRRKSIFEGAGVDD